MEEPIHGKISGVSVEKFSRIKSLDKLAHIGVFCIGT